MKTGFLVETPIAESVMSGHDSLAFLLDINATSHRWINTQSCLRQSKYKFFRFILYFVQDYTRIDLDISTTQNNDKLQSLFVPMHPPSMFFFCSVAWNCVIWLNDARKSYPWAAICVTKFIGRWEFMKGSKGKFWIIFKLWWIHLKWSQISCEIELFNSRPSFPEY